MRIGILYPLPLTSNNKQTQYFTKFIKNKKDYLNNTYYYLNLWNTPINHITDTITNLLSCNFKEFIEGQNIKISTNFIYKTYLQFKEFLNSNPSGLGNLYNNIFQNQQFRKEIEKYLFGVIKWIKEYGLQKIYCFDSFFLKFLEEISYFRSVNKNKLTQINELLEVYFIKDINYHNNTNVFSFKEIQECIKCVTCNMNEPFLNIIFDNQEMYNYFLNLGIHTKYYCLDKTLSFNTLINLKSTITIPDEFTDKFKKLLTLLLTYQKCNSLQNWDIITDNYQDVFHLPLQFNIVLPVSIYSFIPSKQLMGNQTIIQANSNLQIELKYIFTSIMSKFKLIVNNIISNLLSWCHHCKLRLLPEKELPSIRFQLNLNFTNPDVKLNYQQLGKVINITNKLHSEVYNFFNLNYQQIVETNLSNLSEEVNITLLKFKRFGNFFFKIKEEMQFNTQLNIQNIINYNDFIHSNKVENIYNSHLNKIISILKSQYDKKEIIKLPIELVNNNKIKLINIKYNTEKEININNYDTNNNISTNNILSNEQEILILENKEDISYFEKNEDNNFIKNNNDNLLKNENKIISLQDINKLLTENDIKIPDYLKNNINTNNSYQYQSLDTKTIDINNTKSSIDIYYIHNVWGGGSKLYMEDIKFYLNTINNYQINFIKIKNKTHLQSISFKKKQILILQYLIETDITLDDIITILNKYDLQLLITFHDYYWLNSLEELYYKFNDFTPINYLFKYKKILPKVSTILNHASFLICPNQSVFNEYNKIFLKDITTNKLYQKMVVMPHIDYSINKLNNFLKLKTDHSKIIRLGIITSLSKYKGVEIITYLINKYIDNPNIKFYLFTDSQHKFNDYPNVVSIELYNELEILQLLSKYKINGLIFLNIWYETYSYAFTKGLISKLPLLISNIGAIKYRINHYLNTNININGNTNNTNLNYIYLNSNKSKITIDNIDKYTTYYDINEIDNKFTDYLNLITSNKYYCHIEEKHLFTNIIINQPEKIKYDNLSRYQTLYYNLISKSLVNGNKLNNSQDTNNKYNTIILNQIKPNINVVLISSKIVVSDKKYSYCKNRSIYTTEERYQQTINTIVSIRKYLPQSFIILVDNSKLEDKMKLKLLKICNLFLNDITNDELNYYTDECIYKGIGEAYQLHTTNSLVLQLRDTYNISNLFKISGRYLINETFNYEYYDNKDNLFKNAKIKDRPDYHFTSFYKIAGCNIITYYEKLKQYVEDFKNNKVVVTKDYEITFPSYLQFKTIPELGITQNISVWKEESKI